MNHPPEPGLHPSGTHRDPTHPKFIVRAAEPAKSFTAAVIPDTQNYLDYTHQRAAGFPFDAGDVWQSRLKVQGPPPGATPSIRVRTYSTLYKSFSTDTPQYIAWYKEQEKPQLSDAEYLAADDFTIELTDFVERFPGHR